MKTIYEEIEQAWLVGYGEIEREPPPRSGFSDVISEQQTKTREIAGSRLLPHLAILEFGIEWLSYIHIALDEDMGANMSARHHACWALTGSAVTFGLAIRELSLAGLDTPAKALLRTYVENLLLCLAILDDEKLAADYVEEKNDEKEFWHKHLSPKKLHTRIVEIEKKIGFDPDLVDNLVAWRVEEYEVLSQSSHLSYVAAALSCRSPALAGDGYYEISIFGLASKNLTRTVWYAAATTWYFSRLGYKYLLNLPGQNCLIPLNKENEFHQMIFVGREVLSKVMLAHWGQQPDDESPSLPLG